jgi:hypothetical protein
MGQYRPQHRTGDLFRDGTPKYADIDRRPEPAEVERAKAAARRAGLRRLDGRVPVPA